MSSPVAVDDIMMDDLGREGTGVIWDLDPNLTHEIYEDLGVEDLEKVEKKKIAGGQKQKNKNLPSQKAQSAQKKPVVHTTPSPSSVRTSAQNHIHNGKNCSCQRRILKSAAELDKTDPFSYLSDEVILSIFHWLPKRSLTHCAKVCQRWRLLSCDEELWRSVDLASRTFPPGVLGHILQRGMVHVKLAGSTIKDPVFDLDPDIEETPMDEVDSAGLDRSLCDPTPLQLESLDLSASINESPSNIQHILSRCPKLRRLSLESCRLDGDTLLTLANRSAALEVLDLAMCSLTQPEALTTLIRSASGLRSLNISWLNLSASVLKEVISVLPTQLKHLNLSGYRENLQNQDVTTIVTRCHDLVELDLSDSTVLSYEAISAIVQNLPCLQHIALSRCYDIPFYAFVSMIDISTLKAMDVFGVMQPREQERLKVQMPKISFNSHPYSSIGRPTYSSKQPHHIWGVKCDVI